MKATVDRETCIGCGLCESVCPDVFAMDDEGKAIVIADLVPSGSEGNAKEAKEQCPVNAIAIVLTNDLKFAINMELDGEKYYRKQAELNKDNSLYKVCLILADEEKNHARMLTDKLNEKPFQFVDTGTLVNIKNIFEGIGNIKTKEKEALSQLDFYRIALGMEKQSIELYAKYASQANGDEEKALFEYLVRQEKRHYDILDELAVLLSRTSEWVENAEFGVREEY